MAVGALADTLKLNNGTTVEGNIIAETDTEYIVERTLAGGTIKTKDTIRKRDVASVVRATPEEKAAAAMKEAYDALKRYQLDPNNSYAKDYYDQVLNGSFRKFLADYPDSPFTAEVRERVAAWEAERDKVVAGQIKRNGQWLSTSEASLLDETQRAQKVMTHVQALSAQGKFQEAIQLLQPLRTAKQPAIAEDASRLEYQFYGSWQTDLDARLRSIASEMQTWETRLKEAIAASKRARENLEQWKETHHEGIAGYKGFLSQHEGAIQQAEVEQKTCNLRLTQLRGEATLAQQKLNEIQSQMEVRSIPTLRQPPPPPPPPPPEKGLIAKVGDWLKEYWLFAVLGLLLVIWLAFRRR